MLIQPLYMHFAMFGKPQAPSRESRALGITPRTNFLTAAHWASYYDPEKDGMRRVDVSVAELAHILNEDYVILTTNYGEQIHAILHKDIVEVSHLFYHTNRGDTLTFTMNGHTAYLYAHPKTLVPQLEKQGFEMPLLQSWKSDVGAPEGRYVLKHRQPA